MKTLTLRPMAAADLHAVEPWFDDPATKEWLGDRSWPSAMLAVPARVIGECQDGVTTIAREAFVAADRAGALVGMVDVEVYDDRTASLAFVVAPHARRSGIGRAVLAATEGLDLLEGVDRIDVGAEPGNVASIRCLRAAGYEIAGQVDDEGFMRATRARPATPAER